MDHFSGKYPEGNPGGKNEAVLLTCKAVKINDEGTAQQREIVVTNKAFYNFAMNDYWFEKRRIDIEKIKEISFSDTSHQFIIHVPDEYDYRYSQQAFRVEIVKAIFKTKKY